MRLESRIFFISYYQAKHFNNKTGSSLVAKQQRHNDSAAPHPRVGFEQQAVVSLRSAEFTVFEKQNGKLTRR
jgi:hypothetical protein